MTISVTDDLETVLAIRRTVFIEEQGVTVEDEVDGKDPHAIHLIATSNGNAVGTARLLMSGKVGKIGRVAVLKEARGTGLGKALVLFAVEELSRRCAARAMLGAQTHAIGFCEALGFSVYGPEFLDAGIPHREMVREL
ncbi:GNAT family N-acetyltransferase [Silicimonas sp. MF1-12-2]|uniref:GNAT family N-acetyltransferase n=1 Tax=Silicimonas sp. MF1-12-2 TaxID=3384793 RepID=UPI0039B40B2C